jgi:protein SDA1
MLKDPNEGASKRSLNVMIELYKRKIWNDDKTINVIAEGCLHENPKIVASSCKFFIALNYSMESDSESESSDEEDKKLILKQRTGSKVTKNKMARMERAIK